jgi:hypothetical protein
MEGACMTTPPTREIIFGLALDAYGLELRLWRESDEREWGATLRDGSGTVQRRFQEDNLELAKLHLLAEARKLALGRSPGAELPGCDAFDKFWKPVKITKA